MLHQAHSGRVEDGVGSSDGGVAFGRHLILFYVNALRVSFLLSTWMSNIMKVELCPALPLVTDKLGIHFWDFN